MSGSTHFFKMSSTFSVYADMAFCPWEALPTVKDLSPLVIPPFSLPGGYGQTLGSFVYVCAFPALIRALDRFLRLLFSWLGAAISLPALDSSRIQSSRFPVLPWFPRPGISLYPGVQCLLGSSCSLRMILVPGRPPVSSRSLVELAGFFEPWTGSLGLVASHVLPRLFAPSPWFPRPGSSFSLMGSGPPPVLLFSGSVLAPEAACRFLLSALGISAFS